jgi:hypothetical protein
MWLHFPTLLLATPLHFEVFEKENTWVIKIGAKNNTRMTHRTLRPDMFPLHKPV